MTTKDAMVAMVAMVAMMTAMPIAQRKMTRSCFQKNYFHGDEFERFVINPTKYNIIIIQALYYSS